MVALLTFMFTLYTSKCSMAILIFIQFALATNTATTLWAKPLTIRDMLYIEQVGGNN